MSITGVGEVIVPDGGCGSWWGSHKHYNYLHKCVSAESHEDLCRCECGKIPPPKERGFVERTRKLAKERRSNDY